MQGDRQAVVSPVYLQKSKLIVQSLVAANKDRVEQSAQQSIVFFLARYNILVPIRYSYLMRKIVRSKVFINRMLHCTLV